ncbi:DUF5641 domain-containing protein [Trichonephila clavipes]|nr:DUF5641 domain-containing protein [Trichonephila clavipes]
MFLISNKNSNIEDIEELNSNSLNKRIKYRSKLLKDLRQRFRNEYLSQLIQKHNEKESRDPQIGEVVLVGDDNKKRLFWALAKIIELIPGRDGKIRTVRLKTQHGKMLRPIQRIYSLEIRSNENLQRGLEESIPTVSETLSPDEEEMLVTFHRTNANVKIFAFVVRAKLWQPCTPFHVMWPIGSDNIKTQQKSNLSELWQPSIIRGKVLGVLVSRKETSPPILSTLGHEKCNSKKYQRYRSEIYLADNMLCKDQKIKITASCDVWMMTKSVINVAATVGYNRCLRPRQRIKRLRMHP